MNQQSFKCRLWNFLFIAFHNFQELDECWKRVADLINKRKADLNEAMEEANNLQFTTSQYLSELADIEDQVENATFPNDEDELQV